MASDVYTGEFRANWARSINPKMMVSSWRMSELRMFCSDSASLMSTEPKALAPRLVCAARWPMSHRPADLGGPWVYGLECFSLQNISSAMSQRLLTHCVSALALSHPGGLTHADARLNITRITRQNNNRATLCTVASNRTYAACLATPGPATSPFQRPTLSLCPLIIQMSLVARQNP